MILFNPNLLNQDVIFLERQKSNSRCYTGEVHGDLLIHDIVRDDPKLGNTYYNTFCFRCRKPKKMLRTDIHNPGTVACLECLNRKYGSGYKKVTDKNGNYKR